MAEQDCIFCRVVGGDVRADIVFQDDRCVAFRDINPQAPVHVLVIPRQHITALWEVDQSHEPTLGHLLYVANEVAAELGVLGSGYRVVINSGPEAGQSVDHLHLHVLGGRKLDWPPG